MKSCHCSLAESTDIHSMLRVHWAVFLFLQPVLFFLSALGADCLRGLFKLLEIIDLSLRGRKSLSRPDIVPNIGWSFSQREMSLRSLEQHNFSVVVERRLQMSEEREIGVSLVGCSMEPDESLFGVGG